MKIAFDTRPMKFKGTGISIYTRNIYESLSEKRDPKYIFIDGPLDTIPTKRGRVKFLLWNHITLSRILKKEKVDIYHATRELEIPLFKVCKYISTIHDTVPYIYQKEYYKSKLSWWICYGLKMKIAIKNSDIIITDSEYSKNDIIKYFKVDPNKIKLVYLSADKKFKIVENNVVEEIRKKFKLDNNERYILGIGGKEFRKNVVSLIKAFNKYKAYNNDDVKLIIVGKQGVDDKVNNMNKDVIYTGFVEDNELVALYNGATAFVYPSLYEGFGLPPLEAMACGTAVITSNTTSIPEVVGDAAYLVNPEDVNEISIGIDKVINNEDLRKELISKGFEQLKKFTHENTVNEIEKVYMELSSSKR